MSLQLFISHHLKSVDTQFIERIHQDLEVFIQLPVPTRQEGVTDLREELELEWKQCQHQIHFVQMSKGFAV